MCAYRVYFSESPVKSVLTAQIHILVEVARGNPCRRSKDSALKKRMVHTHYIRTSLMHRLKKSSCVSFICQLEDELHIEKTRFTFILSSHTVRQIIFFMHNKFSMESRVEVTPEVEPFPYILDNTRECYYFSSFGSAKMP